MKPSGVSGGGGAVSSVGSGGSGHCESAIRELESAVTMVCGAEIGQQIMKRLTGDEFSSVSIDDLRGLTDMEWDQFESEFGQAVIRDLRSRFSTDPNITTRSRRDGVKSSDTVHTQSAVAIASSLPPSVKKVGAIGTGAINFEININAQSQTSAQHR